MRAIHNELAEIRGAIHPEQASDQTAEGLVFWMCREEANLKRSHCHEMDANPTCRFISELESLLVVR